jgi:hypothetical protein
MAIDRFRVDKSLFKNNLAILAIRLFQRGSRQRREDESIGSLRQEFITPNL